MITENANYKMLITGFLVLQSDEKNVFALSGVSRPTHNLPPTSYLS